MKNFLEIGCFSSEEQAKLIKEIEDAIAAKKINGVVTEREIREIEEMRLKPFPDIQDVQSVYEDFLFCEKEKG